MGGRELRGLLLLVVASLLAARTATPAAPSWKPAGFGGAGAFIGLAFDRAHPGVVYAASDVSGVHRSTDRGDHWETRSLGLGNLEVASLAVDPFDSRTLYAGAGALAESSRSGMYVSHDAGLSWQLLPGSHAAGLTFRRIRTLQAIAPDPTARGVILAGTRWSGIWRTTDAGATFSQVLAPPQVSAPLFQPGMAEDDPTVSPYPAPVSTVAFDPTTPTTVLAAVYGAGVYRSTASGVAGTWAASSSGLPAGATVVDLALSAGGVAWVAAAEAGVFRSADGGLSWVAVNGGLPLQGGIPVSSVAAHPSDPLVAYATVVTFEHPSLWRTANGGVTWSPQGEVTFDEVNNPTRVWAGGQTLAWLVRVDPTDPRRVYYLDYWAIHRSDDAAATTFDRVVGAQNTCVANLFVDADHASGQPDTVYAALWDAGLLASTDRGATWQAVQPTTWDPDLAGHCWDLAVTRYGGKKVWLATIKAGEPERVRIRRSTDGVAWSTVLTLVPPPGAYVGAFTLAAAPGSPGTVYAALDGDRVYRSTNGGLSWVATPGQPGETSFTYALEVDGAGRVFVGTSRGGLWRSTDGGASWEQAEGTPGGVFRLAVAGGAVYAAGVDGGVDLVRSTDGGATWAQLATPPVEDDGDGVGVHGMAVAVDPADPAHILYGTADNWHSADAGAGVAESTDGGATWQWVNQGLGLLSISTLAFGSDGTVYAGTSCGGTWRRDTGPGPCRLGCDGLAPAQALVGTAVTFEATTTLSGCAATPVVDWDFGDGSPHASTATAAHAYQAPGTYTWELTVTADGATCTDSGEVTVARPPCRLTCHGEVSSQGTVGEAASFSALVTPSSCTGTPVVDWEFGDGSPHVGAALAAHAYQAAGSFTWTLTVTVEGVTCTDTGVIAVAEPPPAAVYFVPSVAHLPGNAGTQWRTDVAAVNRTAGPARLTLTYYSGAAPLQRRATLDAGASAEWRDILLSLYELPATTESSGTLHVASSAPLGVVSRTYNQAGKGTFGQGYPALLASDGLATGQVGLLPQLRKSEAFRTNLGVVNLSAASCQARVRLHDAAGTPVGRTRTMTVAGQRWLQQSDIFLDLGAGSHELAYATVEPLTPGCLLWAYASVIDQETGDPTTVPVLVP